VNCGKAASDTGGQGEPPAAGVVKAPSRLENQTSLSPSLFFSLPYEPLEILMTPISVYFFLSSSWARALNKPRGDELIDSF
jgi:hypothetical protein